MKNQAGAEDAFDPESGVLPIGWAGKCPRGRDLKASEMAGPVDEGLPVSGAAVRLGKTIIWSDAAGNFFLRVAKNRAVPLVVIPEEFTMPGIWETVIAPVTASPGESVRIVVRRGNTVKPIQLIVNGVTLHERFSALTLDELCHLE